MRAFFILTYLICLALVSCQQDSGSGQAMAKKRKNIRYGISQVGTDQPYVSIIEKLNSKEKPEFVFKYYPGGELDRAEKNVYNSNNQIDSTLTFYYRNGAFVEPVIYNYTYNKAGKVLELNCRMKSGSKEFSKRIYCYESDTILIKETYETNAEYLLSNSKYYFYSDGKLRKINREPEFKFDKIEFDTIIYTDTGKVTVTRAKNQKVIGKQLEGKIKNRNSENKLWSFDSRDSVLYLSRTIHFKYDEKGNECERVILYYFDGAVCGTGDPRAPRKISYFFR